MASSRVPHVKKILYPFQHGFQKGKSCVTQLLEVFYDIHLALDRGLELDIIYLDLAKAFNSVCPAKLVLKLKTFGIDDPLLSWFYSCLNVFMVMLIEFVHLITIFPLLRVKRIKRAQG